jgi:hypothetical protein
VKRLVAVAGVGCSLAIAACGSSSTSSVAAASRPLRFSECMRSHDVPNFPDPGARRQIAIAGGLKLSSPALRSALTTCAKLLGLQRPGGPISEAQRKALIANAQCMRAHGVPDFPDPVFPSSGGVRIYFAPGMNPQSPAFQQAARVCGGPGAPFKAAP